jgi:hypothetical protein
MAVARQIFHPCDVARDLRRLKQDNLKRTSPTCGKLACLRQLS